MTQSQKMKKALEENVISKLSADGFAGEYPDYRKDYPDRIELISFPKYKYGNAFYVLASVAYPNREKEKQNIDLHFFNGDLDGLTADHCIYRYFMKGNFRDCFYYTDVYRIQIFGGLMYEGVSETRAKTYKPKRFDKLVQKADENIYQRICDDINKKMPKVYKWWAKMSKR